MLRYRRMLAGILAWFLVGLGGCSTSYMDSSDMIDCDQGELIESGDAAVCVYRQEIIETGFDCPSSAPFMHEYGRFTACSDQQDLPPDFPSEMQDRYSHGLPSDGCVSSEQCSGANVCNAGECVPIGGPPHGGFFDTGNSGEADAGISDAGEVDAGDEIDSGPGTPNPTLPDVGAPDAAEQDASEPDIGEPDADLPDIGNPDTGGPIPAPCIDRYDPQSDSSTSAPVLAAGAHNNLVVCADPDFYGVALQAGDRLRVEVDYDPAQSAGDIHVGLFDTDAENYLGGGYEERLPSGGYRLSTPADSSGFYEVPADGTYYVLVNIFAGKSAQYDMKVQIQ